MRFRCESCGAQYAIADEKLGRKGVRVRCKKCGEIIAVRPGEVEADERPQQEPSAPAKSDGLNLGEDEDLKNAFDGLLDRGSDGEADDAEDPDRQSTRVFNVEEMQQIQQERNHARTGFKEPSTEVFLEEDPRVEWYVALDDQQLGPISRAELLQRIGTGEFEREALVWRNGFDDWLPVREVPEFASAISGSEEEPSYGAGSSEDETAHEFGGDRWNGEQSDEVSGENQGLGSQAGNQGAAVDWKPSALSSLSRLAEEELQSLRPEDPQPEESEDDGDFGGGGLPLDEGMTDGESSLLTQIAEEEVTAARRIEEERLATEQEAQELQRRQEEQALAAQEAAAREKQAEQRKKATGIEEQRIIPPKGGMPRWVIGLITTSALLLMAMSIAVLFAVYRSTSEGPQGASTAVQPSLAQSALPVASESPTARQPQPNAPASAPAEAAPAPAPAAEVAPSREPVVVASAEPPGKKTALPGDDQLGRKKPKTEAKAPPARPERNERVEPEPRPEPRPEPPVRKKSSKGGILDFEEDDDKAYAASVGLKPVEKPKEEVAKKEVPELSNAAVLDVMKDHIEEFKACNRRQKERDASVNGKMVVSFVINTDGKVGSVNLSAKTPQFKGTFVAECITGIIRRLKFPECSKQKPVDFPFSVN